MSFLAACGAGVRGAISDGSTTGCYTFGHEVNVFKPAGVDSVHWVVGAQDVLQQLRRTHDSLTSKPYERVWVRVVAQPSSQKPDGFAQDYSGLIEIKRVLEIRQAAAGECR